MPAPTKRDFGEMLRRLRTDAGMTQEILAERAGYSTVYISMLERGRREPAGETVAVLGRALQLPLAQQAALAAHVGAPEVPKPDVVGRDREQETIERHLDDDVAPVLLLAGEPGIGKSTLLRWTSTRAVLKGLAVLPGSAQRGIDDMHAPLADALRRAIAALPADELAARLAGCAWLLRLLPELSAGPIEPLPSWHVSPEVERRLMAEACVRFLANLGPSLLVLDDLQWAGTDGLELLAFVARSAPGAGLHIIAAYRDTEIHRRHPLATWIADLAHAELVTSVPLGPLDIEATARLLGRELGGEDALSEVSRTDLVRRSGGVPFYLVSCAQALHDGSISPTDVPWSVAQSVRQRIAALPPAGADVLAVLAVAAPADGDLIAHVSGRDAAEAIEVLEAGELGRLVEERDAQYLFTHDLIREVVEAEGTGARRALLHRCTAEYLEHQAGPAPVDRVARHLVRGNLRERALPYLERAGEEARRRYAIGAATGYFRELLDILAGLGREQDAAASGEQLGETLTVAAEYDEALAVLADAERRYREQGDVEGIWRSVAQVGRIHASRGTAEEGIRRVGPSIPSAQPEPSGGLARLFTSLARLHFVRGEYTAQLAAADEARRHARGIGDRALLVDATNVWSVALGMLGRIEESLEAYEEVISLGTEMGLLEPVRASLGNAASTYIESGKLGRAREYVDRALGIAELIGDPTQLAFFRAMRGELAYYLGDLDEADSDLEAALAFVRTSAQNALVGQTLVNLARLRAARGDVDAAIEYLGESLRTEEIQTLREAHALLAEIDLAAGRPQGAIARLLPLLEQTEIEEWDATPLFAPLAEARLALGQTQEARRLSAAGIRRARSQGFGLALVDSLRAAALVENADGNGEAALALLDEAAALARSMPYPLGEARLLVNIGRILEASGDQGGSETALTAAMEITRRVGAVLEAIGLADGESTARIRQGD